MPTYHNPNNALPNFFDPNCEGWRLLTDEELSNPPADTEFWSASATKWEPYGNELRIVATKLTYRTKAPLPFAKSETPDIPEGCLPFDLEKAKAGHPLRTRGGQPVKFVAHVPEAASPGSRLLIIKPNEPHPAVLARYEDGRLWEGVTSSGDIFLAAPRKVKKEGWVNIYGFGRETYLYNCKASADAGALKCRVACVRVEWEEEEK